MKVGRLSRFIIVFVLTLFVIFLPTPKGLSVQGKMALSAFVFTSGIFALQPVSLPFSSLMVMVSLIVLGIATSEEAFITLSRPIIILILGSLFLAEALRKHGLIRRLAMMSIVASNGKVDRLLFGIMGITAFLSMWMENTATSAVFIPVALTITNQIGDRDRAQEVKKLLVLGIAYAASLGGMVTITGSASNAVASSFLSEIRVWTFIDWMKYGLPAFLLIFPITWWVLTRIISVTTRVMDISIAKRELEDMGEPDSKELEIIGIMIVTASLWTFGPIFEDFMGLTEGVLSPPVVGVIAVTYMSLRGIIEWDDVKDVSWGMFFTLGAGLALGEALTRSGATEWLTSLISPIIFQAPMLASLLMLIFASALATNVVNNATIAAIFVPIFINMSKVNPEFNAIQLVLPLTLATTFGYSLPSASGRMALLSSMKIIEGRDMMRYGMVFTVISSIILALFFFVITEINLL